MNNDVLEDLRDITLFPVRMTAAFVRGMGRLAIEKVEECIILINEPEKDL